VIGVPRFGLAPFLAVLMSQLVVLVWLHLYRRLPVRRLTKHFPDEKNELEVVQFLRSLPEGGVVITLPQQLQNFWARYTRWDDRLPFKFLFTWIVSTDETYGLGFDHIDRIFRENIQFPSYSPEVMRKEYGLGYVIALNKFMEINRPRSAFIDSLVKQEELIFSNEKYSVFRVGDAPSPHAAT